MLYKNNSRPSSNSYDNNTHFVKGYVTLASSLHSACVCFVYLVINGVITLRFLCLFGANV